MKIDSSRFDSITYSLFNSISTIFSDFSNSRHYCCLNLFYGKFYLFHGFHGLASNLTYITPNMIMISHSNGYSLPSISIPLNNHIIRPYIQNDYNAIHAILKIYKPLCQDGIRIVWACLRSFPISELACQHYK